MKQLLNLLLLILVSASAWSQSAERLPEFNLSKAEIETQLRFLASDELQGRKTGEPGNTIAARFIAAHLHALGYASPEGAVHYFQRVPLTTFTPPQEGMVQLGETTFSLGEDLILLDGAEKTIEAPAVYAGYGWVDEASGHDDYRDLDVTGKVVITLSGLPDSDDPSEVFKAMSTKRELAAARGAVALVEVYTLSYPWRFFRNYFGRGRTELSEWEGGESPLIHAWLQMPDKTDIEALKDGNSLRAKIRSSAAQHRSLNSQNVVGVLEGSDPKLKDEYILLTAHFDHVGTQSGGTEGQDTIFNGARDNAMGVVALMAAAKALAKAPPKRSVIILAVTAEEIGLLGSQYYAEHPLVPLEQTVFNLNTDGAGYNVTNGAAIIGWGRTGTDKAVEAGLAAFDLEVIPDPAREQNLFDRSDNVSFARMGVPCLTFSPGFKTFDQELMQYYHQVADEADSVDFDYVQKFAQAFAHTARLIANGVQRPMWEAGDKYEAAGKELYGQR